MDVRAYLPLVPLLVLACGAVVALLAGIARRSTPPERPRRRVLGAALAVIAATIAAAAWLWPSASGAAGHFLVFDGLTLFALGLALAAVLAALLLGRLSRELAALQYAEWATLLLLLGLGLVLMAATTDLLMAYLAMEFVSLGSYVLTAFRRGDVRAHEAALKYVIYGGVASGVMLFGMSLLFGLAGATGFAELAAALGPGGALAGSSPALRLGVFGLILLVLVGFGFKVAAVPFHMWSPDVYEGAPTPFTAFLSVGPKAAGLLLLARFLTVLVPATHDTLPWAALLGVIAAATMTLGNLTAIPQTNVKRLLAFSSIAQAGYLLMALTALTPESGSAVLTYLAIYLFMNLGAFAVVQRVADAVGSAELEAFQGLATRAPYPAVALAIFLFALTGLPPLAGFIGKFYLFAAVFNAGGFYFTLLALIGLLNSALSLYYYARVVRAMFLEAPATPAPLGRARALDVVTTAFVIPVVVLGVYWEPLRLVAESAALPLFAAK